MKNVLIPTDLSVTSLYPIHAICERIAAEGSEKCNIYVIHTLEMPTGIMDLLFSADRRPYKQLSPKFQAALEMLREKYAPVINMLCFEFILGHSVPLLRNYMQHRDIQTVYMLEDFDYAGKVDQTVNCAPILEKCKVQLEYVPKGAVGEHRVLTTLLYHKRTMPV